MGPLRRALLIIGVITALPLILVAQGSELLPSPPADKPQGVQTLNWIALPLPDAKQPPQLILPDLDQEPLSPEPVTAAPKTDAPRQTKQQPNTAPKLTKGLQFVDGQINQAVITVKERRVQSEPDLLNLLQTGSMTRTRTIRTETKSYQLKSVRLPLPSAKPTWARIEAEPEPVSELKATEVAKIADLVQPQPQLQDQRQDQLQPQQADPNCHAELRAMGVTFTPLVTFANERGCGIAGGVELLYVGGIEVSPPAKLNCPFAKRIAAWIAGDLSKTILRETGAPLSKVKHYSAYRCSFRSKGRLSEHGTGNAFDLAELETGMGIKLHVKDDWGSNLDWAVMEPMPYATRNGEKRPTVKADSQSDSFERAKRAVWFEVTKSACNAFQLVLTPHSNRAHADHLHIDMGRWKQCEL